MYAERFRCIASACEDTCCSGWGVPIDRGTYEKYRSVESLKPYLGKLIVLNPAAASASDYARISLTAQQSCPFLDADRLCAIQTEHGAGMLSATCATYPRAVSTQAGQVERALNLSCPEAARVTLLDPNLLGDLAPRPSATGAERYAAVRYHAGQPLAGYDPRLAIREFVLLLLGDRGYPLWQRLYLLGTLSRRLETLSGTLNPSRSARPTIAAWCAANPATVARMLADSSRSTAHGGLREVMAEIVPNPGKQLQLVAELLRLRLNEAPVPERFLACLEDFELGLGLARAANETEILAAYTEAERRFYRPLMARHPYLLENYLMNYVFKNGYPFGRPEQTSYRAADVEGEHLALCVHAALVQTLAIAMAGRYREAFDTGHVVRLVQSLARAIEHSTSFPGQIAEFVRAHSLRTPQGIALLLMPPA